MASFYGFWPSRSGCSSIHYCNRESCTVSSTVDSAIFCKAAIQSNVEYTDEGIWRWVLQHSGPAAVALTTANGFSGCLG
ncbi:hypothetical protein SK128_016864 [Halocaridina rubra]|uniref:Uncharacterized protein n=1 Tax=Halocaridina rubra TaxID=373956 RepID=A0AAN9ABA3_HALRR